MKLTGYESDVLAHQLLVHSDQGHGQGVGQELALEIDSLADDLLDGVGVRSTFSVIEHARISSRYRERGRS